MAAYAAIVSLMHIIDQIQHHPRPPISLDKDQVESLTENVTFLQEFLEGYSHVINYSKEADPLESRIAGAAYAAENVIESHIVDQILAGSRSHDKEISCGEEINSREEISSIDFYRELQKVVEDMDSIKRQAMEIKENITVQDHRQKNSTFAGSLRSSSTGQNNMVGFHDVSLEIMDKLTGGQLDLHIISIAGMGGIGKTTLARNIYQNQVVVQHFDILAWVTISQEYSMRGTLLELLKEGEGNVSQVNEYELGDKLHKRLSGRRYLIVMDDIWDIEVWNQLKCFFPNNNSGSRIILTTRLSNLASRVANSCCIEMGFLNKDNSWNLFSNTVFGEEDCPLELEEIGKKIVKNCRGLPLSIVVIGGLLAKSRHTREYWEYIAENLTSVVNSEDNESCFKILYMSYNQLPVHLKPCFLYMGVFKEDSAIRISMLLKLWVAEGFLKPISGKSLEEIAKDYLKDLIDRNLILVHSLGSTGNIKFCNIHDLLRDLCLREVQRERFYNVIRQRGPDVPQDINIAQQYRIVIPLSTSEDRVFDALQSMSLARSLMCCDIRGVLPPLNFRLLRILRMYDKYLYPHDKSYFLQHTFELVNSRYLALNARKDSQFSSSVYLLWNLHTLIVHSDHLELLTAPAEIWNMPQLRHVEFSSGLYLPDPPSGSIGGQGDIILGNLQTLLSVKNFKCGEDVFKGIPNIKKLKIQYQGAVEGSSCYYVNNLERLRKLESFACFSWPTLMPSGTDFLQNLTFPHSLKKLSLNTDHNDWEDMLGKIGSLPLLEKLRMTLVSFPECRWETVEGQFRSLKFLKIYDCFDLEYWITESSHFPRLEHLILDFLPRLKEIPLEIGEIPTLQSIELDGCSDSTIISTKRILEEQEISQGEVALQVLVYLGRRNDEALESLASPNFQVMDRFRGIR